MDTSTTIDADGTAADFETQMQRLSRNLRSFAAALRRRGLWLVFGALGGLIGGGLVAYTTEPPVVTKRYYKATAVMRLTEPVRTSRPVDPVQWSLQLAQLTVASDTYKLAVATEAGVSTKTVKNHVISVAYQETASIDLTAVSVDPDRAVRIAYHAANELNAAIAVEVEKRRERRVAELAESIADTDAAIDALNRQLADADEAERDQLETELAQAERRRRLLVNEQRGSTTSPPEFIVSSEPEAIRVNSRAYYSRWSIASNDVGIPRIQENINLANVGTSGGSSAEEATQTLLEDTDIETPTVPHPIQPISLGLLAGLVMGISGVVLGEAWDDRVHDSGHAARATGLPIITEIPHLSARNVRSLLGLGNGASSNRSRVDQAEVRYREAAWLLTSDLGLDPRADLDGSPNVAAGPTGRPAPILLVTSTSPSEGKTTTTAALAAALGQLGLDVLAVDGDYHQRVLRKLLKPIPSFVDPEAPAATRHERVQFIDDPESADRKATSSAIAGRLMRRVEQLRDDYDIILLDTPPVLSTTDAVDYLQYADAAVVVVRIDRTVLQSLQHAMNTILRHGLTMPGMVVIDVPWTVIDQQQDAGG